jgi:AraC family transcriptional regulator of adaptative response / DNA-3-methyladenine glycosylase II
VGATLAASLPAVLARVKTLFDLSCRPDEIAAALGPLAANPGCGLPGAIDGFEVAVRAILGQQVTVKAATTVAARFAKAFGDPIETPHAGLDTLFPTPARVAALDVDAIARLGIIAARARAILALAAAGRIRKAAPRAFRRRRRHGRRAERASRCRSLDRRSTSPCARSPGPTHSRTRMSRR